MLIVYFSNITENTHRFIVNLNWDKTVRIPIKGQLAETVEEPFVLICPSYGTSETGHVPPQVKKFFKEETHRKNCVGVIGSGNINFGEEYAMAGDVISAKLNIPHLYRFELAGTTKDLQQVAEGLKALEARLSPV